uniref:CXXC-type zinc finger protein 1 n=1 Tax=Ditylenchus dipsaci TaxID=166011 RepID=A0A915DIW3_9BILA
MKMEDMAEEQVKNDDTMSIKTDDSPTKKESHCLCDSRDYSTFMICCDFCGVWYHGDCVQVTRTTSKRIEKYFCSICISKDNSLEIRKKKTWLREKKPLPLVQSLHPHQRALQQPSLQHLAQRNVGTVLAVCGTRTVANVQTAGQLQQAQQVQQPQKKRKVVGGSGKPNKKEGDEQNSKPTLNKVNRKVKGGADQADSAERKSKKDLATNLAKVYNGYYKQHNKIEEEEERQCHGPECIHSARAASNYCSDTCGLALAEKRLKHILPDRITAYYSQTPVGELQDSEKMKQLVESKNVLEQELKKLDECSENVNNWISTLGNAIPSAHQSESSTVDDGSFMVACAVCTMEFSIKNIGKHMQRCFVRTERQSTFGTALALPQNPRNLVCDNFNKIDKTYCKRLKVMCSEHYKEALEEDIKVCGAPLVWFDGRTVEFKSLFAEPEVLNKDGFQFCMDKRKHCHVHNSWAQNALGLIDNERMNILLQLDENQEKWRQLMHKRASRGDVLSLLCNHTISEPAAANCIKQLKMDDLMNSTQV